MKQINLHKVDWQKVILYGVIFAFIFAYGRSCQSQKGLKIAYENKQKEADSISKVASRKILESELLNGKLADLKKQYKVVEKEVYTLSKQLVESKKQTKIKVEKAKLFTNKEMQKYFDDGYGNSTNSVVHLDSLPSQRIITDLEIGKGAIKDVEILYNENVKINDLNDNLQDQVGILETQKELSLEAYVKEKSANEINKSNAENNFKLYKKEKTKKTLWKLATIPAFVLGVFIAK